MDMVEVKNLSYWYPGRSEPALKGVTVSLSAGEFVLLLGPSGSGKSTLCRALNGLVPHFYGGTMQGSVTVNGINTIPSRVKDLASHVGMVFQDPENQLVTESPDSELAFGLENLGVDRLQMRKRVEEVLATLRLGEIRHKRLNELSGGQKQKVALASVLIMHPEVLVLDEPTSQLDPVSADDFLATLKALNDELGLAVLLSEHRVERCLHFADRVLVIDGGSLRFSGTPRELAAWSMKKPWVPIPPIARLFAGHNGAGPPLTVKEGRDVLAELIPQARRTEEPKGPAVKADKARRRGLAARRRGKETAPALIDIRELWHVYQDGTEALRGIDLEVESGESIALVGENGSGKTTLVKHLNGLLRPSRGTVRLDGEDIRGKEVSLLARTCGMLPQNPNTLLISSTVEGELRTSLRALDVEEGRWEKLLSDALEISGLLQLRHENPADLSCGERERVAIASVIVGKPRMLVLDEPTRGIDQATKLRLSGFLREYHSLGNTVILVTHDLEFAAEVCERVVLLARGRVCADGEKHSVLTESLFYTTQLNKAFRGFAPRVVTLQDAAEALEVLS